jgi:hypothetical protein
VITETPKKALPVGNYRKMNEWCLTQNYLIPVNYDGGSMPARITKQTKDAEDFSMMERNLIMK